MRNLATLILFFFLFRVATFGQLYNEHGKYFIENYTVEEHEAETQTWAALQDNRGVMYFGNNAGVVEYDGSSWRLIRTNNKSVVRSMAIDSSGVIYVGAVGDFGYLAPDSLGKLDYFSLTHLLNPDDKDFKEVWQTCATENKVYFSTVEALYEYTPPYSSNAGHKKGHIKALRGKSSLMGVYYVQGQVITRQPGKGLMKISGDSLQLIPGTQPIANTMVWTIDPVKNNKLQIAIRNIGVVLYDPNNPIDKRIIQPPKFKKVNDFLTKNKLYFGNSMPGNKLLYATLRNGAIITDEKGNIVDHINEKSGLESNNVVCSYYNRGNLWLASHKSISNVEWGTPFNYWDETLGLTGIVTDITRYRGTLFVSTTQGVFYLQGNEFKELMSIQNPAWSFIKLSENNGKTRLLVGATKGLYEIKHRYKKPYASYLIRIPYIHRLFKTQKNPNRVYVGSTKGLFIIDLEKGIKPRKVEGINESIRDIEQDRYGDLWLATRYIGVIHLKFKDPNNRDDFDIIKYNDKTSGLASFDGIHMQPFRDKLLFLTVKGVYSFNREKQTFELNNFSKKYLGIDSSIIHKIHEDQQGNYWVVGNGRANLFFLEKKDKNNYKLYEKRFNRLEENQVIRKIKADTNGITWIAATKGLYAYYRNKPNYNMGNFRTLIREVSLGRDSILYYGCGTGSSGHHTPFNMCNKNNEQLVLKYKRNALIFKFTAAYFSPEKHNEYSFCLERNGIKEPWSEWSKETKKEYTNLYEGDYTFHVKSRNIYGIEGSKDSFSFEILPPLHRTTLAYIIYVLAGLLLLWGSAQLHSRRLKTHNIRLERIIQERTSEINQQKEEIQTQNDHLEQVNDELKKLSVVTSKTDNAITIMDPDGNFEWVNAGFRRIYGYNIDQLKNELGSNLTKAIGFEDVRPHFNECTTEKRSVIYSSKRKSRAGVEIWTQTTLTPILGENRKIDSIVAIDTDITKIKEAERFIEEQNKEIKKQRDIAINQKNEITDSIEYAKHIQNAILPSFKLLDEHLKEYFVYNKPKSIVSGDFYWVAKRENKLIIAVADCTGHGVPGALMSMLGVTFLNKIVLEKRITKTSEILNRLRSNIIRALHQTGSAGEASDGMDIAVAVIDINTNMLQFSGAMNPLLLIRKTGNPGDKYEFIRLKHDIMPIAINQMLDAKYTSKEIELIKGDSIYLFTDGFTDQFGGKEGMKFTYKKFKELLLNIQEFTMDRQKEIIDEELTKWKGNYHQTDDILVLGYRYEKD